MEPHADLGERFVQSDCQVKGDDETVDSLQHRKVGRTGINPTLAAAGHLLCILSAVGRTGINPALAAAGHLL